MGLFLSQQALLSNEIKTLGRIWRLHDYMLSTGHHAVSGNQICYGNGLFVVCGNPSITTSVDGTNWDIRYTASPPFKGVTYNEAQNRFVAVGATSIARSTGGIDGWSANYLPAEFNDWDAICYGNGLFVALDSSSSVTRQYVARSTDGATWSSPLDALRGDSRWVSLCYGNGLYVAVAAARIGGGGAATPRIATSTDGVFWTHYATSDVEEWDSVCYGNGLFVATSSTNPAGIGKVLTSPDGVNWTLRSMPDNDAHWGAVCYGAGMFVAIAHDYPRTHAIATSADGINWTLQKTPAINGSGVSICYGDGKFVALIAGDVGGQILISE